MICLGDGPVIDAGKFIRSKYEHLDLTLEDASDRFIEIRERTSPEQSKDGFGGARGRIRRRVVVAGSGGGEEVVICDMHCINGMGLLHLFGVGGLVDRNVNMARWRWFEQGKDMVLPRVRK